MLTLATVMIGLTVVVGAILAVSSLRASGAGSPPAWLAAAHGLMALGGLGVLLMALRGPSRGVRTGTESFGTIAAILLGAAALAGIGLYALRVRGRRQPGGLVGVHATLAISGFVILAAYALLA